MVSYFEKLFSHFQISVRACLWSPVHSYTVGLKLMQLVFLEPKVPDLILTRDKSAFFVFWLITKTTFKNLRSVTVPWITHVLGSTLYVLWAIQMQFMRRASKNLFTTSVIRATLTVEFFWGESLLYHLQFFSCLCKLSVGIKPLLRLLIRGAI